MSTEYFSQRNTRHPRCIEDAPNVRKIAEGARGPILALIEKSE